jgi:hypothetical protein
MTKYRCIYPDGDFARKLLNVGILDDGTLHNPNGYPDDIVRAAVQAADARRHARRSEAAKRAAVTRRRRQEKAIWIIARRILAGHGVKPAMNCSICGRGLDDPDSIERGVGSECWQAVLACIEHLKAGAAS